MYTLSMILAMNQSPLSSWQKPNRVLVSSSSHPVEDMLSSSILCGRLDGRLVPVPTMLWALCSVLWRYFAFSVLFPVWPACCIFLRITLNLITFRQKCAASLQWRASADQAVFQSFSNRKIRSWSDRPITIHSTKYHVLYMYTTDHWYRGMQKGNIIGEEQGLGQGQAASCALCANLYGLRPIEYKVQSTSTSASRSASTSAKYKWQVRVQSTLLPDTREIQ